MDSRNYSHVPFEHIRIDGKAFQKGHKYVTVISPPKSGVMLDVGEGRDTSSTERLLDKTFTKNQLESINTVSMDMWRPYMQSVERKVFNAEIVHNKFHLVKYLNEAIDKVRRREGQNNEVLKNSRYVLLKNEQNLKATQQVKYQMIKDSNFEVARAMNIRENVKSLFDYCHDEGGAVEILKSWAQDSFQKGIKEMNKVITTFLSHAWGIVNALISGVSNAMAERLHGKIQEIKLVARGYRKFQDFRSAILFFHGGLDLYPLKW